MTGLKTWALPTAFAGPGYGYPEAGRPLVVLTNDKIFPLWCGDEPFDVRYGELISHERTLNPRAGTLTPRAPWRSPRGQPPPVTSTQLA
ncbi:hypothetical protein FI98_00965 [Mycobacterium tuberculosis]|nr:hypothetical protein FI98_00965 [Mycobacterium tuberculosis]